MLRILARHSDGKIESLTRSLADSRGAQNGANFFLYLLSDAVVDAYFPVLDALSDEIDALEDALIQARGRTRIHRIFETGFFGMNFTRIPFDRGWLLALAVGVMMALPVAMLLLFTRRGWLSEGRPFHPWSRLRAWLRRRR